MQATTWSKRGYERHRVTEAGWPFRCLEGSQSTAREHFSGPGLLWIGIRGSPSMPYHPRWTAFVCNALLYAALLWPLFLVAPRTIRRHRRARRGLCLACGYPVGESAVCSECGKAVRQPKPHRDPAAG